MFVLFSLEMFSAIFSNEIVVLSCSISVLKTIYAKHKLGRSQSLSQIKWSTYIKNPITPQILWNIYQPLQKLVYQTYPPLEQYSMESTTHYENITYKPTDTNYQKQSKHKRKIIWVNSPFSKNILTKIGKSFLSLLDLYFPRN